MQSNKETVFKMIKNLRRLARELSDQIHSCPACDEQYFSYEKDTHISSCDKFKKEGWVEMDNCYFVPDPDYAKNKEKFQGEVNLEMPKKFGE